MISSWLKRGLLTGLLAAVCLPLLAGALAVPPAPTDIPVVDQTNTLSQEQRQSLAATIASERQRSGNQLAILMVASLEGQAIEEYSLQVARQWGIGGRERNNGVLLLVAKDDRSLRIEVGYGLEGGLTDARASRIIRERITPQFRAGNYFEGLRVGLEGINLAIKDEVDPALAGNGSGQPGPDIPWEFVAFAIFFGGSWLGAILGRTKSWWAGGVIGAAGGGVLWLFFGLAVGLGSVIGLTVLGLLFDRAVSANYRRHAGRGVAPSWWAGGSHLGGGGNGFGGFGGGSFGGGGSSGNW